MRFGTPEPTTKFSQPDARTHVFALAGIFDLGSHSTDSGPRDAVALVWSMEQRDDQGRRMYFYDWCNVNLHPKAKLGQRVAALLGRPLSEEEQKDFDPWPLLGGCVSVRVGRNDKDRAIIADCYPLDGEAIKPEQITDVPRYVEKFAPANYIEHMRREIRGEVDPEYAYLWVPQDDSTPI